MKHSQTSPLRQPAQKRPMSAALRRLAARRMAPALTVGALMILGAGAASAQTTLTWDPTLNPTAPVGGAGSWDYNTTANWSNGTTDVVWPDNNAMTTNANFAGTGGAVNVATQVGANQVNIQASNYVFSGLIIIVGAGGINITPGVNGTTFNNTISVNTAASATPSVWTNSDLATFTTVQFAGSRTITITNADNGTTVIPTLNLSNGTSSRGAGFGGSGNVTINALGPTSAITGLANTLSYTGTGIMTINGNNTTFAASPISGQTFIVRPTTGILALGNDGALGAATLQFNGGTVQASSASVAGTGATLGTRTINNTATLPTNSLIGGTQNITFSGSLTETNSGTTANRSITNNNTALTTFSGPVFISNNSTVGNTFTVAGTGATLISGVIADFNGASTGPGNLVYNSAGGGSLTLSNTNNTYTGTTTVNGGTLIVNGSTTAASAVTVGGSAATGTPTLAGSGTVNGTVLINTSNGTGAAGTINAGGVGSVGVLTTGAETFNTGGTAVFDFTSNSVDELHSLGLVSGLSNATFTFNAVGGATLTGASYTILQADGGFANTNLPTTVNNIPTGYALQENGNQLQLVNTVAAPEPSQFVAFGLGMLGLGGLALRARRRSGVSAAL